MSHPRPALNAGTLLRHLGAEFARLADIADAVQSGAAGLVQRPPQDMPSAKFLMVELQALDSLSQVLGDLQRLADAAASSHCGRCRADPDFLRRHLLLQSLADRLIAGPDHDDGHDPAAFLL